MFNFHEVQFTVMVVMSLNWLYTMSHSHLRSFLSLSKYLGIRSKSSDKIRVKCSMGGRDLRLRPQ